MLSEKVANKEFGKEVQHMKTKNKNKVFDTIIIAIVFLIVLVCVIPFFYVIAVSLSSNDAIISQIVGLIPVGFNLETYRIVFSDHAMIYSLMYTVGLTALYTAVSMVLTICAAFALTRKRLKGRKFFMIVIVITMYFSGGIIPDYILVKNLNLLNNMWSLILPGAISVYNLIILKAFFSSLPESLEESAILDGCTDIGVLIRIVLPLSIAGIATLSLFYAVGRWNGFMDALFYTTDPKLFPIQLKLYQIVSNSMQLDIQQAEGGLRSNITPEGLKAASVIFATIPILIVYPWLQKYFINGVMLGSIKE